MTRKILSILLASAMAVTMFSTSMADEYNGYTDRTLMIGMTGNDVLSLQNALYDMGYLGSYPDGDFGADTLSAVIDFQYDFWLEADGVAGPATLGILFGVSFDESSSSSASYSIGMSGDGVYTLQQRLFNLGYLSSAPDGVFGSGTEAAVIAFQYANGLSADGVAGEMTNYILASGEAVAGSSSSSSDCLRIGMSGSAVASLQSSLYSMGYLDFEPTGYFGEMTEAAVIAFQADNGLEADGVAGEMTLSYLGYGSSDSSSGMSLASVQDAIVNAAYSTYSTSQGYCAEWVTQVLKNSGVLSYGISSLRPGAYSYATESGLAYSSDTGFNANDYWAYVCYSDDLSALQPGMVIATRSSNTYLGRQYGHVGIYVGNDTVLSSIGYVEELSVSEWIRRYNNYDMGSTARWGYIPF